MDSSEAADPPVAAEAASLPFSLDATPHIGSFLTSPILPRAPVMHLLPPFASLLFSLFHSELLFPLLGVAMRAVPPHIESAG